MKLPGLCAVGILLGHATLSAPILAATYVVHPNGTGDFPTIQAAIDASVNGDIIELSNGTFTGDGNRDLSYLGKAIIVRSQGGAANCTIDPQGLPNDEHNGFRFDSGEGSESVLEGVTIRGGNFAGGGINVSSSPVIRDCVITQNSAGGFHTNGRGGGIHVGGGSAYFAGCLISENTALTDDGPYSYGGGAYIHLGSPTFEDCQFLSNYVAGAQGLGGNIFCAVGSSAVFLDCTISDGRAFRGAGIYCDGSSVSLTGCLIADNMGGYYSYGGGAYCRASSAIFEYCIFVGNVVHNGGGALWCEDTSPEIQNCTFYGNGAEGWGGGIGLGGTSVAEIANTIVASSTFGGAILCQGASSANLTCCDLFGNVDGDWVGCVANQAEINGNISLDPLFCDAPNRDFRIDSSSPCRSFTPPNPECDLIGAWPVGCGVSNVAEEAAGSGRPGLRLFPNPTSGTAQLRLEGVSPGVSVRIFDAAGRIVWHTTAGAGATDTIEWDGRDLQGRPVPRGVYFVTPSEPKGAGARLVVVR